LLAYYVAWRPNLQLAQDGGLAALDVLSACNLVNYFGKSESVDDITVYPILLAKGKTKVAIYGLGNVRDERLYRTFQQKKVKLMRPVEDREKYHRLPPFSNPIADTIMLTLSFFPAGSVCLYCTRIAWRTRQRTTCTNACWPTSSTSSCGATNMSA
jgi:hypothetical protein